VVAAQEEKDQIIGSVRGEVKAAGIVDTNDNVWDFFIEKVHLSLSVSSLLWGANKVVPRSGATFTSVCASAPSAMHSVFAHASSPHWSTAP
jgi:hypothetical protein